MKKFEQNGLIIYRMDWDKHHAQMAFTPKLIKRLKETYQEKFEDYIYMQLSLEIYKEMDKKMATLQLS